MKIHSDDKPYQCPLCSYKCRRRDALNGHMRIHSDQRPYRCAYCERSYKSRQSMKEHEYQCPFKLIPPNQRKTKTSEPSLQPIPPLMFNQMRPAGLPNLLSNPLLRFGFQPQPSHPILNTTGLYTPMVNPMNIFPKINESLLNPVTLPTVPSVSSIDHAETSPLQSRPTRKRSHSKSSESDQSEKQAKISRIEPKEENPSSATSSSSELTAADISANKSDEAHDSHDEIKVYRNGTEIEISKCDICKCIFLDKQIYSIHMGAHVQQTMLKYCSTAQNV